MGVLGWQVVRTKAVLTGLIDSVEWADSAHLINLNEDGDWSVFIRPSLSCASMAVNSAGVTNAPSKGVAAGLIECEVLPVGSSVVLWDELYAPLQPPAPASPQDMLSAVVTGPFVEDKSHDDKTEIHPVQSLLVTMKNSPANTKVVRFYAFADNSQFTLPYRPLLPPDAQESVSANFTATFPPSPSAGSAPSFRSAVLQGTRSNPLNASIDRSTEVPSLVGAVVTGTPHEGKGLYAGEFTLFWQ